MAGEAESRRLATFCSTVPDVGDRGQAADADGEDDPLTSASS